MSAELLEQLKGRIRCYPGEHPTPTFFRTNPLPVGNPPMLHCSYLVVDKGDDSGLGAGIYLETDIRPAEYSLSQSARVAVRKDVTLNLARLLAEISNEGKVTPRLDLLELHETEVTPDGSLIIQIIPNFST